MNRLTLDFKLICERALGDKDVGEVHVPIKELLDTPSKPAGADRKQFVSYQVRKPSGKPKGQLFFSYQFGEKIAGAAATATYASPILFSTPPGKVDTEPVTAYPAGPSSAYPLYPPPPGYPATEGKDHYPPAEVYTPAGGYPPPSSGYGYPPPPQSGYGYPPPPMAGYGYPPQAGYGYPQAPPVQKPAKKNKLGMGLGAGLLGGALGGLLIGDMISDAGDFDGGCDF
ncbi:hypothetical protein CASFOL_030058 [Castilleja foliolosa]|uniref:Uncharacterized protein n=1 Tax=Castilleja foliolosa TaxID=1961234 RepID=A0ABD3CAW2_9LAMI